MDDIKVCCIDSRRSAIDSTYTGNDEKILKMINDFFERLEEFAKGCNDVTDFESKFQSSPLSQEYTNLFTKIMGGDTNIKDEVSDATKYAVEDALDSASLRVRREVREEVESNLRNTPIVGDVMTAKQHFDLFSCFRKKKDE